MWKQHWHGVLPLSKLNIEYYLFKWVESNPLHSTWLLVYLDISWLLLCQEELLNVASHPPKLTSTGSSRAISTARAAPQEWPKIKRGLSGLASWACFLPAEKNGEVMPRNPNSHKQPITSWPWICLESHGQFKNPNKFAGSSRTNCKTIYVILFAGFPYLLQLQTYLSSQPKAFLFSFRNPEISFSRHWAPLRDVHCFSTVSAMDFKLGISLLRSPSATRIDPMPPTSVSKQVDSSVSARFVSMVSVIVHGVWWSCMSVWVSP